MQGETEVARLSEFVVTEFSCTNPDIALEDVVSAKDSNRVSFSGFASWS